jgi:hypothetical protein
MGESKEKTFGERVGIWNGCPNRFYHISAWPGYGRIKCPVKGCDKYVTDPKYKKEVHKGEH